MTDRTGAGPRRRVGRAALAVLLFWMLVWPVLSGDYTAQTVGNGAAIAVNLLLLGCLGLFYRPDRAGGFVIVAASATVLAFLGLLAVILAWEGFLTLVTTPKPL